MTANQILQCVARIAIRYKRDRLLKWCLKKRQQQLHKQWGWNA